MPDPERTTTTAATTAPVSAADPQRAAAGMPAEAMSDAAAPGPAAEPVLELLAVTVESADGYDEDLVDASLVLRPGDLAVVRLEADAVRLPLADAACGLVEPGVGSVRFGGQDWCRMGFGRAARERGRIGRTFEGLGWVANLDVDENVMLSQRHHTRRSDADLVAEAAALAGALGLPDLPRSRPAQTRRPVLARAALARAFMGDPALLLLERPEVGLYPEVMTALAEAVRSARRRGAAVLWLTSYPDVWRHPDLHPTARYAIAGARMTTVND